MEWCPDGKGCYQSLSFLLSLGLILGLELGWRFLLAASSLHSQSLLCHESSQHGSGLNLQARPQNPVEPKISDEMARGGQGWSSEEDYLAAFKGRKQSPEYYQDLHDAFPETRDLPRRPKEAGSDDAQLSGDGGENLHFATTPSDEEYFERLRKEHRAKFLLGEKYNILRRKPFQTSIIFSEKFSDDSMLTEERERKKDSYALKKALKFREEGNDLFRRNEFKKAAASYSLGAVWVDIGYIKQLYDNPQLEDLFPHVYLALSLHLNSALAFIRESQKEISKNDCFLDQAISSTDLIIENLEPWVSMNGVGKQVGEEGMTLHASLDIIEMSNILAKKIRRKPSRDTIRGSSNSGKHDGKGCASSSMALNAQTFQKHGKQQGAHYIYRNLSTLLVKALQRKAEACLLKHYPDTESAREASRRALRLCPNHPVLKKLRIQAEELLQAQKNTGDVSSLLSQLKLNYSQSKDSSRDSHGKRMHATPDIPDDDRSSVKIEDLGINVTPATSRYGTAAFKGRREYDERDRKLEPVQEKENNDPIVIKSSPNINEDAFDVRNWEDTDG